MADIRYPLVTWNLESPLLPSSLAGEPPPTTVQWRTNASAKDHRLLNVYLASHTDTMLRLQAHVFRFDPDVLRYYWHACRVAIAFGPVASFESLRWLRSDLAVLILNAAERRNISLKPIRRFEKL